MLGWAQVRMSPSGQQFEVAPAESVLSAALKAGINFPYGCNNGTCGMCAARVVSGSLAPVSYQDFVFDSRRKYAGYALMCCQSARSDVVIEVAAAERPEDIPLVDLEVRIQGVRRVAAEVLEVNLKCSRALLMRYLSGQRVRLELAGTSALVPLASCPCEGIYLSAHVDCVQTPAFAQAVASAKARTRMRMLGPIGGFCLRQESISARRPIAIVAEDVGVASAQSLLSQLVNLDYLGPVRLVWSARAGMQSYAANLCRSLLDALEDGQFVVLSAETDALTPGLLQALNGLIPLELDVYLAMRANVTIAYQTVLEHGVLEGRIFDETQLCDG